MNTQNFNSQNQNPRSPQGSQSIPRLFSNFTNFFTGRRRGSQSESPSASTSAPSPQPAPSTSASPPPNQNTGSSFEFLRNNPGQFMFNNGMTSEQLDDAYFDYMTRIAIQRSMQDQNPNQENPNAKKMPPSASENARENLPIIKPQNVPSDCKSCPVCFDDFEEATEDQIIRQMPCKHVFHEGCLFPWLKTTNSCPQCRYPLLTENSEYNETVLNEVKSRYKNSPQQFQSTKPCELLPMGLCYSPANTRMIKLLNCTHLFHAGCLKSSHLATGDKIDDFITQVKCPLCRKYSSISSSLLT
ncbi:hypothetical protein CONCODRAFT_76951 [Conidiobolus coronatus NRRL 28638]|uniref:RING-type domain-containing protein n=1 Tax=Conidiobolus coronatus (strain ATCC 28846 / CBS 209.66 / NRRL 28638) TaxID=796925 RepID=A0A137PGR9_CONC2|nr:hypothetical protein CONCODRAFT_76951 [Conidiobolus coronatus NRRL 28638]|eukprot:KXN74194.1 hypothetical protein CONCODRAFT_76951 [Conidiobolus coronatus NRRL 28638]